jgi:hypothetical protein
VGHALAPFLLGVCGVRFFSSARLLAFVLGALDLVGFLAFALPVFLAHDSQRAGLLFGVSASCFALGQIGRAVYALADRIRCDRFLSRPVEYTYSDSPNPPAWDGGFNPFPIVGPGVVDRK